MRLFVGIFPPPEAIAHLAAKVADLHLTRRVVPPERWHITMAFLGEVDDAGVASARLSLESTQAAIGALALSGGGTFGQVLWAGVAGDVEGLRKASRGLRRALRARRLHPDDKQFRPHLTLARSTVGLSAADLGSLRDYQGPSWPVTELVLVHSEPGPHPSYHRLGSRSLG